jgi:hypothetical protein
MQSRRPRRKMNKNWFAVLNQLPDEAIAYLVYATEDYDLENLAGNTAFRNAANRIDRVIGDIYRQRKLDYNKFDPENLCPHCGQFIEKTSTSGK